MEAQGAKDDDEYEDDLSGGEAGFDEEEAWWVIENYDKRKHAIYHQKLQR